MSASLLEALWLCFQRCIEEGRAAEDLTSDRSVMGACDLMDGSSQICCAGPAEMPGQARLFA